MFLIAASLLATQGTHLIRAGFLYDAPAALLADETLPGAQNGRNGVWTYGAYNPTFAVFTPFTAAQHLDNWPINLPGAPPVGTFQGYGTVAGDQTPCLTVNTDTNTAHVPCCDMTAVAPGKLVMHPSSPGGNNFGDVYDVPAVRWTAPAAGVITLTARWVQRHSSAQQARVFTNGVRMFVGLSAPGAGTKYVAANVFVPAGGTVDVGVAPGSNGYGAGTTEVDMLIDFTATTPQPIVISKQPTNLIVAEAAPASFSVAVNNLDAIHYQWQRDGQDIAGATNPAYSIPNTGVTDDGAAFQCVLTNSISTNISVAATLTVMADLTPPALVSAQNDGTSTLFVAFSEAVEPASATDRLNYALDHGVMVTAAALGADGRSVKLSVTPLTLGLAHTLTVRNIRDRAAAANPMAPNAQIVFTPTEYRPLDIGNPFPPSTVSPAANGSDITTGGQDIGGAADQFHFSYQQRTGDFDVRARIEALSLSDAWAKAGLMARETLHPSSRFVAALATPSSVGAYFLARASAGAEAVPAGFFPVNYPETWVRLKRAGNGLTGFASLDGEHWSALGATTLALSNTLYFGLCVASHTTNRTATARFREVASVDAGNAAVGALPFEPLAACSRRTGLVISEIMYHPSPRANLPSLEYVELFNSQAFEEDLTGHRLSGDIDYRFPSGTILPAGAFLVIAREPETVQGVYGIRGVLGPFVGNLPNDSGVVRLRNEQDAVLLEVSYSSQPPWPRAADGAGPSLVLARPSYGEGAAAAWAASERIGGSPGAAETIRVDPLRDVMINELLARGDGTTTPFLELYNHSAQAADLSGCFLSDEPATNKFRIAPGSRVPGGGFLSFTADQLGFSLNAAGGTVYLVNSNQTGVVDAVGFRGQARGVAFGRFPDGAPSFHALAAPSPGGRNSALFIHDVVINEIMYHPISGQSDDEFVELYNLGAQTVSLAGWEFTDGIRFAFPARATVPAGGYLVVAKNLTNLLARYPHLNSTNTVGDFGGTLAAVVDASASGIERRSRSPPAASVPPKSPTVLVELR